MHQPLIPGCLIIKFTITQNAQYRNHFHNVLCLSEAKGMDIKMEIKTLNDIFTLEKEDIEYEKKYAVVLYNDDITPVEFVLNILISVFQKSPQGAIELIDEIQDNGQGIAGIYGMDEAYEKLDALDRIKAELNISLLATVEEVS